MTQIPVFTSIETYSQIISFGSFVFTFYLNERIFDIKSDYCKGRKDIVLLQCK